MGYFEKEQSAARRLGTEVRPILSVIAGRFLADNPPFPAVYHLRHKGGFSISADYMDEIKLHEKFPDMEAEQYVYAMTGLKMPASGPFHFRFGAYGPVRVYVNGEEAYRTPQALERFPEREEDMCLILKEGENELVFECISTPLGCGFRIGSSSYKGKRIQFFAIDQAHRGMSGFSYTRPVGQPLVAKDKMDSLKWFPEMEWKGKMAGQSTCKRLFGGRAMVQAARIFCISGGLRLRGTADRKTKIYLDGREIGTLQDSFDIRFPSSAGSHLLALFGGGVNLIMWDGEGRRILPKCPVLFEGILEPDWLYAGPFEHTKPDMEALLSFCRPFSIDGEEGKTASATSFWQVDLPEMYLRPFNESTLYGEWSYPLGVTMYGLIQSARLLKDEKIRSYVKGHMEKCTGFYEYCLWDQSVYGAAPFHNQLTTMDSLDDCGSFASAVLEVMKDTKLPWGEEPVQAAAKHMRERQYRLEDGTFYRDHSYLQAMNQTMWADDLYMSVPFLCRYYKKTGQEEYLEEAVRQLRQITDYLYMPCEGVLSHIYDTRWQVQTKVPWGRGNGWALFSAAELLDVLPLEHKDREGVLEIFQRLSKGYLRLQDESGLWHQVLTMKESYLETSCTAMFVYAFAKGVQNGWFEEPGIYAQAAVRGWQGLCSEAIDCRGNIYGVCRGSGYSFSREYYAYELGWNLNDTHGTGIVLLAGIEVEQMEKKQEEQDASI